MIKWNAVKALSISGQDICQRQANPVRVHAAQLALPSQVERMPPPRKHKKVERDDHDLAVYEGCYRISAVLATQNLSLGVEEQKDIFSLKEA